MTRRLLAVFVTLVPFSLPAVAQEDETDRRPVGIPAIEEVQAALIRLENRPDEQRILLQKQTWWEATEL
ncbi:MAG: hypothetical protein OXG74_04640 [Acidobacteria bacterium]|nr:hypothetical protein [Acidobacteriota bacterium]